MVVRVRPRQLALALPHAESLTRDNFLEGPANAQALALIDGWPDWPNRVMMLAGPERVPPGGYEAFSVLVITLIVLGAAGFGVVVYVGRRLRQTLHSLTSDRGAG